MAARRPRFGLLRVPSSHSAMLSGSCAYIRIGAAASRVSFLICFLLVATFSAVTSAQCVFPGSTTCVDSPCIQLNVFSFCDCPNDKGSFDCSVPTDCTQQPSVRCGRVLHSQSTSAENLTSIRIFREKLGVLSLCHIVCFAKLSKLRLPYLTITLFILFTSHSNVRGLGHVAPATFVTATPSFGALVASCLAPSLRLVATGT